MTTPFVRAKANDSVEALDNLIAYLDAETKDEIVEYISSIFSDIERVMTHASANGIDPIHAYEVFVAQFNEYWRASPS